MIIIFAVLGSLIGVTTHIDSLQFQQIDQLNEKLHALDKQVAINNERILMNNERIQANSEEANNPP
jgi:uncharacterized membrane protein affecting hemolysin expression